MSGGLKLEMRSAEVREINREMQRRSANRALDTGVKSGSRVLGWKHDDSVVLAAGIWRVRRTGDDKVPCQTDARERDDPEVSARSIRGSCCGGRCTHSPKCSFHQIARR